MAEARPKHQWVPPTADQHRFSDLAKHLKCSHKTLRSHCTALSIDLKPPKRRERYPSGRLIRKQYKRHLRFLSTSEVTRIMVRHYELQGRRVQRQKDPA